LRRVSRSARCAERKGRARGVERGSHEAVADTLFNMSMIYDNIGDESKGLELTRRAHSIWRQASIQVQGIS
jgi:hypothetical protein